MYDVPGRVNNLYKDPQVPYEIDHEPEDEVGPGYPPQCEFTRATGRGTLDYCNALGPPPKLESSQDKQWIVSLLVALVLISVFAS